MYDEQDDYEKDYGMKVSEILENVSNGIFPEWWCQEIGLCNQDWKFCIDERYIRGYEDDISDVFKRYWVEWELFSGNDLYPVPYNDGISTSCPYIAYDEIDDMYQGFYGQARKELAKFLADKIKNEV
ncbi:hypothetical protein ZPAH1_orf00198 [Aeromonas phage ZPAH1]|nr:hypothetical protein ASwh1_149 [Aeromonas phage Aswh_1]QQG33960.1 hypothetical protein ZPAH1_orf00198 [Aeromonas phage ZPAH1]